MTKSLCKQTRTLNLQFLTEPSISAKASWNTPATNETIKFSPSNLSKQEWEDWNMPSALGWSAAKYREQYHTRQSNIVYGGPVGISDTEGDFFISALHKHPDKLAQFQMTVKAHKIKDNWNNYTPPRLRTRPIVCYADTFMSCWSWLLDYQLQRYKPFTPTYLQDSNQVIEDKYQGPEHTFQCKNIYGWYQFNAQ